MEGLLLAGIDYNDLECDPAYYLAAIAAQYVVMFFSWSVSQSVENKSQEEF